MLRPKPTSRPSAAPGTDSADKRFDRAVWRLTGTYTLGAFVVLAVFTAVIYVLFIRTLMPETPDVLPETMERVEGVSVIGNPPHEVAEALFATLLYADGVVLLITALLGYLLARATLDPIRRATARERRFVAEAAHELRTPLAVLLAGADVMLAKSRTPEEYREYIGAARSEVRRLGSLANNLLVLARHDSGVQTARLPVDLTALVRETCDRMRWYAQERGVSLTEESAGTIVVTGDHDALVQVLMNLLKNAIDHGGAGKRVLVSLARHADEARVSVRDYGAGIPAERREQVFERFVTVSTGSPHAEQGAGAGLGLALVRELVAAQGGTVALTSEVGQGTEVVVSIPLASSS